MIDNKTGKDRRCAQCGTDEFRIDGFCSRECRDKAEYEEEINDLQNRLAEMKAELERLVAAVINSGNKLLSPPGKPGVGAEEKQ